MTLIDLIVAVIVCIINSNVSINPLKDRGVN